MRIITNTKDRKNLAKVLAGYVGSNIHYMGPPSFAYAVGDYIIDRDGDIISELEEGENELRSYLVEQGIMEREADIMNVTVPLMKMDAAGMTRLVFMLHSKQYLLNKALGSPSFALCGALVEELDAEAPSSVEEFLAEFARFESKGLSFDKDNVTFTIEVPENQDKAQAFVYLAAIMVTKAQEAKRISPKLLCPENEKYYFRTWLVQLGLGGTEAKAYRNTLMAGLKGHAAFRTDEDAAKFKADQKAKRAAKKTAIHEGGEADA